MHARFLFGWLDPRGRDRALTEFLRAGRPGMRLVVLDYDWSTAAGPAPLVAWKDSLLRLISAFGFDPYYGKRLPSDVTERVSRLGVEPAEDPCSGTRYAAHVLMRDAMGSIGLLGDSLTDRLASLGLTDEADERAARYAAVVDHAHTDPLAQVTLPAIVTTAMDVPLPATAVAPRGSRHTITRIPPASLPLSPAGPVGLGVWRLEFRDLVRQARRLHAAAYVQHGHHTGESVDSDGFLIPTIDPPELVARSTYLGVLDPDGGVCACIRMIRPENHDNRTLPTMHKLARRPPDAAAAGLPFEPDDLLFEGSGRSPAFRAATW